MLQAWDNELDKDGSYRNKNKSANLRDILKKESLKFEFPSLCAQVLTGELRYWPAKALATVAEHPAAPHQAITFRYEEPVLFT